MTAMRNLDMLVPKAEKKTQIVHPDARYRKATVTGLTPLAIQLDGDDAPLDIVPDHLDNCNISRTTQRVLVLMLGEQVIVEAVIDPGDDVGPLAPVGSMMLWAGDPATAPLRYHLTDGASLDRNTYPDLFSVIGTNYGSADSTHFNLPTLAATSGFPYIIRVLP